MTALSTNLLRYGRETPLPEALSLRAGPLSLIYSGGDLRYIRLGSREIVRRLYVAVRDRNWNTIPMQLSDVEIDDRGDSFQIAYKARHRQGEIDFAWAGTIVGDASGTLRFNMDGVANSTFLRNRIGFCILHPADVAGVPCVVEHVDGSHTEREFPLHISPHQPFFNIRAITHEVLPGVRAEVRMEGDTFEMEDQRNWTDASYKTYSTPLAVPFPAEIAAGTAVQQAITVTLAGMTSFAEDGATDLTFTIEDRAIGTLPRLGLGLSSQEEALDRKEIERLRALHLSHLRVDLDFAQPDWSDLLLRATDEADSLGCRLEIALHLSQDAETELAALRDLLAKIRPPVLRWLVYHKAEKGISAPWIELARAHLYDFDRAADMVGGTNLYFTELNRNRPPADLLDAVCYSMNPQVHAFDNFSLLETLPTQGDTVVSTRQFVGDKPIVITPITLQPRFNPNATGDDTPVPAGELPPQVDERQMSLFGAAWTVGSLKALAESGVESITYYETVGWRGVMESETGSPLSEQFRSLDGAVFPLYHVLAAVAGCSGAPLLASQASHPMTITGFAFRHNGTIRGLIANLTHEIQAVTLQLPGMLVKVRVLDETNAVTAMTDPVGFRAGADPVGPGHDTIHLHPYAVAMVELSI